MAQPSLELTRYGDFLHHSRAALTTRPRRLSINGKVDTVQKQHFLLLFLHNLSSHTLSHDLIHSCTTILFNISLTRNTLYNQLSVILIGKPVFYISWICCSPPVVKNLDISVHLKLISSHGTAVQTYRLCCVPILLTTFPPFLSGTYP